MPLKTQHFGPESGRPLVILHGLFGSARNWGVIAKRLSDTRPVITVDMRNHGQSPWFDRHRYTDMVADITALIAPMGVVDLLGHSMGGKAAMLLALSQPEALNRLIVADIAPVSYGHTQMPLVDAMRALLLDQIDTRADADIALSAAVDEPMIRSFLLQSLDIKSKKWRLNLDALARDMDAILGFPQAEGHFDGPTLFLTGAHSDYVQQDHRPGIKTLFPRARFAKIKGAGHWLHAEKPREFEAATRAFLDA